VRHSHILRRTSGAHHPLSTTLPNISCGGIHPMVHACMFGAIACPSTIPLTPLRIGDERLSDSDPHRRRPTRLHAAADDAFASDAAEPAGGGSSSIRVSQSVRRGGRNKRRQQQQRCDDTSPAVEGTGGSAAGMPAPLSELEPDDAPASLTGPPTAAATAGRGGNALTAVPGKQVGWGRSVDWWLLVAG